MNIKVNILTQIFEKSEWNNAIKQSGRQIRNDAVSELQIYTPVDTGLLTSQWKVKPSSLGVVIENKTPYASFINDGTSRISPFNMVEKATPKILDDYERAIYNNIDKIR